MKDFFRSHFDKVLLTFLFLLSLGVYVHFVREAIFYVHTPDKIQAIAPSISWLQNTVGQILAALLTLFVAGRGIQREGDPHPVDGNGNGGSAPPDPSPPPTIPLGTLDTRLGKK